MLFGLLFTSRNSCGDTVVLAATGVGAVWVRAIVLVRRLR
jgi:hypothetical protein